MKYFKLGSIMAMVALSFSLAQPAQAYLFGFTNTQYTTNTLNLTLNGGSTSLPLNNSGWYRGDVMQSGQENYIVAQTGDGGLAALGADNKQDYRNFFVFDISELSGSISKASLTIYGGSITSSETYTLFDVTTGIGDLKDDPGIGISGFNDLGDGKDYGFHVFTELNYATETTNTKLYTFNLNQDFINDFNFALLNQSANKGLFAMGGTAVPYTSGPVPEPSSLLLLGAGLLGLAAWRWKHAA